MQKSRIILTNQQTDFASSSEYPLLKHEVMIGMISLFEDLGKQLETMYGKPHANNWKVTKGENYKLMPYVVLDYPSIKVKDFEYVMRTFFWWGHYFSFNLIIRKDIIKAGGIRLKAPVLLMDQCDLWNNDVSVGFSFRDKIEAENMKCDYVRLVKTFPIQEYAKLADNLKIYKEWMDALTF